MESINALILIFFFSKLNTNFHFTFTLLIHEKDKTTQSHNDDTLLI